MTSWAAWKQPSKKRESSVSLYFSPIQDEFSETLLGFLYSSIYAQRTAERLYIFDTKDMIQPFFQKTPNSEFVKESPSSGTNLALSLHQTAPILQSLRVSTLKSYSKSLFQYNEVTRNKIQTFLSAFPILKQTFDVGIVLDTSGCVTQVLSGLSAYQKRTGKKSLRVFVMTDQLDLLREFATKGDRSWTYASLLSSQPILDKQSQYIKTLSDITIMQQIDFLAFRFSSSTGKLLYLLNQQVSSENEVLSLDGTSWKAFS